MAIASVSNFYTNKQDQSTVKDDGKMDITRNIILHFARDLVRDHAEEMEEGYYLRAKDLPLSEKKILLSYAVECIELYEDLIQSPNTLEAAFIEYDKEMQYWIDEVIQDEFQDKFESRMHEAGMSCHHHSDNGEAFWVRGF